MIDDAERGSRQRAVDEAIASARIEGIDMAPETAALMAAYVDGEIVADVMMERVLALYGPREKARRG